MTVFRYANLYGVTGWPLCESSDDCQDGPIINGTQVTCGSEKPFHTILEVDLEKGFYAVTIEGYNTNAGEYKLAMECPAAPAVPDEELPSVGDTVWVMLHASEAINEPTTEIAWDGIFEGSEPIEIWSLFGDDVFLGQYHVTDTTADASMALVVSGFADRAGNDGNTTVHVPYVRVDTTPPTVVVTMQKRGGGYVAMAGDNIDGWVNASEPIRMPHVTVSGTPVVVTPPDSSSRSCTAPIVEPAWYDMFRRRLDESDDYGFGSWCWGLESDGCCMVQNIFELLDRDNDQTLTLQDTNILLRATCSGARCSDAGTEDDAGLSPAAFGRQWAFKYQFSGLNYGKSVLADYFADHPPSTLERAYDILIGAGEGFVAQDWSFTYGASATDSAGSVAINAAGLIDKAGNQADDQNETDIDMTIACPAEYWGDGKPCRPWTRCNQTEFEQRAGTGTSDRRCAPVTVCKSDAYWNDATTEVFFGEEVSTAIPALVSVYSSVTALAEIKSSTLDDMADWFVEQADLLDFEALFLFLMKVPELELEYTERPANVTSDTVCAALSTCPSAGCTVMQVGATESTDVQCSEPCFGHGTCDGNGECTCGPTCESFGSSGYQMQLGVSEADCGALGASANANWSDWMGDMCDRKKVVGCTTYSATNFNERANTQALIGEAGACDFNKCAESPCQNNAVCQTSVQDRQQNTFTCDCPTFGGGTSADCAGDSPGATCMFIGERCGTVTPRVTSATYSVAGGPNLDGNKQGVEGMFTITPKSQFNEPRVYTSREEIMDDIAKVSVTFTADFTVELSVVPFPAFPVPGVTSVFEVYYTVPNDGTLPMVVEFDGTTIADKQLDIVSSVGPHSHTTSLPSRFGATRPDFK